MVLSTHMSVTEADIKKLASLARIQISEEEVKTFRNEIDSILGYVDQLNTVSASVSAHSQVVPEHRNQVREDISHSDTNPNPEVLVDAAPSSESGFVKVKKILN
ncbi:MAG: Asp-tRNA(Asn)/Glu-tRNA(Gln) amidotransferase subunit GatC [Candidatus Taylorbacteria bacterium]|nr:Asp-tRNA(Asn)/Glu-tRNA(Gln) amidotransferase subunit GatC [Candidatus Taylorbacteria bacterium]